MCRGLETSPRLPSSATNGPIPSSSSSVSASDPSTPSWTPPILRPRPCMHACLPLCPVVLAEERTCRRARQPGPGLPIQPTLSRSGSHPQSPVHRQPGGHNSTRGGRDSFTGPNPGLQALCLDRDVEDEEISTSQGAIQSPRTTRPPPGPLALPRRAALELANRVPPVHCATAHTRYGRAPLRLVHREDAGRGRWVLALSRRTYGRDASI